MRRLVVLCSVFAFAFACAVGAAGAQTQSAPAKPSASKKLNAATAAPPVDTRPRYKRDDMPAPVATAPPAKPAATKKRVARKPADAQQPAAQVARATQREVAACADVR